MKWPVPTRVAAVVVVALLGGGCTASSPSASASSGELGGPGGRAPEPAAHLQVGHPAWVAVSVATLWRRPGSPRAVDAPALRRPADITGWLAGMSLAQRRGLSGRADTQALLGDRVVVVALPATSPGWARVAVPDQPAPGAPKGYLGWVPRRQLTASTLVRSDRLATVVSRTTWLMTDRSPAVRMFQVSAGTSLSVIGETRRFFRVVAPGGGLRRLARGDVRVHAPGTPALTLTRASVVSAARSFIGLPYLWAGVSGFGLDCSGLVWLDYRLHGVTIPRDTAPQYRSGRSVSSPRPGDLLFYRSGGVVHHVSMYVGDGQMVHSPHTGVAVQQVPTSAAPLAQEYIGARRELP